MFIYNTNLKKNARELRKNMTDAEQRLWFRVRMRQIKNAQFYRQKIIGDYIVDFYCPKVRLVIEVDGSQHYEEKGVSEDQRRDNYLRRLGLRVLRFSNREICEETESVVELIYKKIKNLP